MKSIKKELETGTVKMVKVPVYDRVYVYDNKLIGRSPYGATEVIKDYGEDE